MGICAAMAFDVSHVERDVAGSYTRSCPILDLPPAYSYRTGDPHIRRYPDLGRRAQSLNE
jgi:hypothetical protein